MVLLSASTLDILVPPGASGAKTATPQTLALGMRVDLITLLSISSLALYTDVDRRSIPWAQQQPKTAQPNRAKQPSRQL